MEQERHSEVSNLEKYQKNAQERTISHNVPTANGPTLAKQSDLTGFSNFGKEEMPFRID